MKKNNKISLLVLILTIVSIVSITFFAYKNRDEIYINSVLSQKAYSYLPYEAKDYVKGVYEKTGEVILTEKNKEENKLYLNPLFVEYLTYSMKEKDEMGEIPVSMIVDYSVRDEAKDINVPSKYDLRDDNGNNYITPVRNQGDLGICWTFATAGVAESHLLKTTNASYTASSKLISERQIDYATSRNGIKDYKNEYVSFINRLLGDGGNFYVSTIALANGISLVDYNSFKEFNDKDLVKMELSDVLSYSKSLYEANSTINFPRLNLRESTSILTEKEKETRNVFLNDVKKNIIDNGAAYVGTFMDSSCRYIDENLSNTVIDVYDCSFTGGHAMSIIGWDDDLEYSYCADNKSHNSLTSDCKNVVSGKGVWILKNSWGDAIQYPYLTYDSLYSSIGFIDELESGENRNWDNNYIVGDGSNDVKSVTFTLADTKLLNDEKIKKVKIIAENSETEYSVKIKNKNGIYSIFSKTNNLPGLITIDITEDILVDKNSEITIYSENYFVDKISVFTVNVDKMPILDLSKYDNTILSDNVMRLYSETKNIPSGAIIDYKVYNSEELDVSDRVNFSNNVVAENNINTLMTVQNGLDGGKYRIDAIYNSKVVESININVTKMEGAGTKDNPYIITNSTHLYQIRDDLDAYYELGNDIDLTQDTRDGGKYSSQSNVCPQGFGWKSINEFSGSLDGKGHTIKGLYQNNYLTCNEEKDTWYSWNNNGNGLFGSTKGNVTIKNLVLEDFDIRCQGGECGALVSKYIGNMNESGTSDSSDKTNHTATFENIAIKNSKMDGVYNSKNNNSSLRNTYGGGLFGSLESKYGDISISNIYLDINLTTKFMSDNGYLAMRVDGQNVNIQNIRLLGDLQGKYTDGTGDSVLIYTLSGTGLINIKNVVSTVTATNVMGTLLGENYNDNLVIDGVNLLNIEDKTLCSKWNNCGTVTNYNIYNKEVQLSEFTKLKNYGTWSGFDDSWEIKTVDGIPRIPQLKFMDFEYTNISDITLNQILNKKVSIYDYLTPKIDAAKQINYKSNNEEIVKVSDDGTIIPQSSGSTTIHVESLYDGYIKDVPIHVTYVPHYTINFDGNTGIGKMESIEVNTGSDFVLPENKFEKEYYVFDGWNTKADGTGISYTDLGKVETMKDKEVITLYAQWIGEERIVSFDANGGTVEPENKIVHYGGTYGDLPIPVRAGYGFIGWRVKQNGLYISVNCNKNLLGYTLIASWKEDGYTVIYDANGGVIKSDYDKSISLELMSDSVATTYGRNNYTKKIIDALYENDGYIFKEWNTKADGTGTSYVPEQQIDGTTVDNSVLRLYAIWENEIGTIIYNSNNGDNQTKTQTFTFNTDIQLDENTFTKAGCVFKEWNTKADGTGTSYKDGQIINKSENIILYAIWENKTGLITYNSNDGNNQIKTQTFTFNTDIQLDKNTFTKTGCVFKEWNTKADGTGMSYKDEQIINKSENITLFAIWKESFDYKINKYNVDEINKYISRIMVNTELNEFIVNIKLNSDYGISVDTKTINNKKVLYTGGKTKITRGLDLYREYTNVVIADINGDGVINSADLLKIRQHLLRTNILTGFYFLSSDVNYDGVINSADLLRVRQHLLGIKPIN